MINMQKETKCKKIKYAMHHTCAGPSPKLAQGLKSEVALNDDSKAGTLFVFIFLFLFYTERLLEQ
jgi:hypothetical protein